MDSALESWDSSGQEGNKVSSTALLHDEHPFDGLYFLNLNNFH